MILSVKVLLFLLSFPFFRITFGGQNKSKAYYNKTTLIIFQTTLNSRSLLMGKAIVHCAADDIELINLYKMGNNRAFSILLRRHYTKIYSSIAYLVKDPILTEDILQDTLIRVINTLKKNKKNYKEEGRFLPWVLRIAHNLCIDYFRKQKNTIAATNLDAESTKIMFNQLQSCREDNAEEKMIKQERQRQIHQLLHYLPAEQREIIVLRHFGNFSFKEIASMTNCSINTALGRMRYALINFRKIIADHHISL